MKIRRVDICGFKSFVDATTVHFDHEVTGIVGPNGCGKSNIVDAIRWAMGEQSAKHLRGKAMEDVIFNGAESRGPHGFAEVSITFENSDGKSPPEYRDYAEICVTRRLDRQGNSEYLINRTPVRLMDVTNLFLGTGVGKRAYSIIEQGRIGFIVSSKPEERRYLIEEAAGVTKYKARKKAAERKMDQTRQNLLRVGDIVQEIERSVATLKRQAQKAERYKRYRAEMRDLELHVASHRWLELVATHGVVAAELESSTARTAGQRLALRVREAEMEAKRLDSLGVERRVEEAQTAAYEADNTVRMLESQAERQLERLQSLADSERQMEKELSELRGQRTALVGEQDALVASLEALEAEEQTAQTALDTVTSDLERKRTAAAEAEAAAAHARARVADAETRIVRAESVLSGFAMRQADARERLERLRAERDQVRARTEELAQHVLDLGARLAALSGGKHDTTTRREEIERDLAALREEIRGSDDVVEGLRERVTERRSRLRSLEEIQQRYEGMGAGVRALMGHYAHDPAGRAEAGIVGLLADRIACPTELTNALAAALGERLQHIVVEELQAGLSGIEFLRHDDRGRATFVPRTLRRVVHSGGAAPRGEGVVGCLADLVRCDTDDEALTRHLLGDVWVVRDMQAALDVFEGGFAEGSIVTLGGELLAQDGTVTGGAGQDPGAHALEIQREIRELYDVVARLENELTAALDRHGELRRGIATRQALLDAARTESHDAEIAIVRAEKDLKQAQVDEATSAHRITELDAEIADLGHGIDAASDEEAEARVGIEAARRVRSDAESELAGAEGVYQQRREAAEEQAGRVTEVRVRAAQARERADGERMAVERLSRSIDELVGREERLQDGIADGARQQGELAAALLETRAQREDAAVVAMNRHEALADVRAEHDDMRQAVARQEEELKALRSTLDAESQRGSEAALKEREISMSMEHLLEHVSDRHRLDLRRELGDYHDRPIPDQSVKSRIDELIRLVERMGEINLTAIEEYEEKSKRFEYLSGQQKDLQDALLQLERAIRQMNRESRRLFREAFDAISERFKRVFPQMFGGGRAELRLTNPEDLLESGVDIVAQPPGKRIGSLELMSGGEKALTAVSLIFAIFQYKPSPFCLLDEVDAPLDEANIGRFASAVRQMTDRSQFILITHAKRTMEAADVLYGVTMETPGVSKLVSVELRGGTRDRQPGVDESRAAVA